MTAPRLDPALHRRLLAGVLASTEPDPAGLRAIAERFRLLPVLADAGGFVGLREDGEVVIVDWDEPDEPFVAPDERLRWAGLARAAARYPDLAFLRPPPTPGAVTCPKCGRSGRFAVDGVEAPEGVLCQCFGLGWVPSDEAPPVPVPPPLAPPSNPTRFEARVLARLEPGERLLYAEENATFHRGLDFGVAVSDHALYVPRWSVRPYIPFRRGLRRVPLAQAESVVLSRHRALGARVAGLALLALALTAVGATFVPPLPALWVVAVLIVIFLFFARRLRWPAQSGRWVLTMSFAEGRAVRCVSPSDSYADEREFDRGVLHGALTACRMAGVPTVRDDTRSTRPSPPIER